MVLKLYQGPCPSPGGLSRGWGGCGWGHPLGPLQTPVGFGVLRMPVRGATSFKNLSSRVSEYRKLHSPEQIRSPLDYVAGFRTLEGPLPLTSPSHHPQSAHSRIQPGAEWIFLRGFISRPPDILGGKPSKWSSDSHPLTARS